MSTARRHAARDVRRGDRDGHTEPSEDELLARRAAAGDAMAFGILVQRYRDRLYRLAMRMMHDPDDAEEVVQEALLNAYRSLPSFRADAKFGTWLHQIVINGAFAHRRRSRRRPVTTPLDDHLPRLDDAITPGVGDCTIPAAADELLVRKQFVARIQDALDRLDDHHRAVFTLRHLEGLSTEAVAELFSIREPTVRQRLHRARLQLRALLADLMPSA